MLHTEYSSYIACILGMPYPIPHIRRIPINTISAPSIFHARAIRYYNGLSLEYRNLFMLTERMR